MGLEFITRIIKTTAIVSLVASLCISYYFDWHFGLGFLIGSTWSLINLFFIRSLIKEVLSPEGVRKTMLAVLALLKFPLLYVAGYYLVKSEVFPIYSLMAGFSLVFVVIVLKVLGRLILGLDVPGARHKHSEGPA
jgi:hypothetical protein